MRTVRSSPDRRRTVRYGTVRYYNGQCFGPVRYCTLAVPYQIRFGRLVPYRTVKRYGTGTVRYGTVPSVLFGTVRYRNLRYRTVPYRLLLHPRNKTVPYRTVPYHTLCARLHGMVRYRTVRYGVPLTSSQQNGTVEGALLHVYGTVRYGTIGTVPYRTIRYRAHTVWYGTVRYGTV